MNSDQHIRFVNPCGDSGDTVSAATLRKVVEQNTADLATLRQQAEQYAKDHPKKDPCQHCMPTIIHLRQNNFLQATDKNGQIDGQEETCPAYYAEFSVPDGSIENRLIAVYSANSGLMHATIDAGSSVPITTPYYILNKKGSDNTTEGNSIYRLTVCAGSYTSTTRANTETGNIDIVNIYYPPDEIDIVVCNCDLQFTYRILTEQAILIPLY